MSKINYSESFVSKAVSCFAVFTAGVLDVEASLENFKAHLNLATNNETVFVRNAEFDVAINAVFGDREIVSRAELQLGIVAALPAAAKTPKVVLAYIEDSLENGRLTSVRGRNGGLKRGDAFVADLVADATPVDAELDIAAE